MDAIKTVGLSKAYGKKMAVNHLKITVQERDHPRLSGAQRHRVR